MTSFCNSILTFGIANIPELLKHSNGTILFPWKDFPCFLLRPILLQSSLCENCGSNHDGSTFCRSTICGRDIGSHSLAQSHIDWSDIAVLAWAIVPQQVLLNSHRALCSRNFQNVKLRLDFVRIWSYYCHSNFSWNWILANSNGPKMLFLAILEVPNFNFIKFEPLLSLKFTKIKNL